MATLNQAFQTLVPKAITSGETLYQQYSRGTTKEDLFAPLAARVSLYVSQAIAPYIKKNVLDSQVTEIAIPLLLQFGLYRYGASKGYNVSFSAETMVLTFYPSIHSLITRMTTPTRKKHFHGETRTVLDHDARTVNQERAGALLHAVAAIATTCILYKLESIRNPSLPLKPYLYYGAGVVLLTRLKARYADQTIHSNLGSFAGKNEARLINDLGSKFLLGSLVAYGVGRYTGETILVNRQWEALSVAGIYLAGKIL